MVSKVFMLNLKLGMGLGLVQSCSVYHSNDMPPAGIVTQPQYAVQHRPRPEPRPKGNDFSNVPLRFGPDGKTAIWKKTAKPAAFPTAPRMTRQQQALPPLPPLSKSVRDYYYYQRQRIMATTKANTPEVKPGVTPFAQGYDQQMKRNARHDARRDIDRQRLRSRRARGAN